MPKIKITTEELLAYFSETIFVTISDVDRDDKDIQYGSTYNETLFRQRQAHEKKYAVYFSVNAFNERRIEANLIKLLACYADIDVAKEGDGQMPEQIRAKKIRIYQALLQAPIVPNFIIITKNGLQPLWLIDEGLIDDATRKVYKEVLKGIRQWTIEQGGLGDKVYDITRILRLPGYLHQKSEPFEVIAEKINEDMHLLIDLKKAFPFFDDTIIEKETMTVRKELTALDKIDIRDIALAALAEYGELHAFFDKSSRIILKRGQTGAYQGKINDTQFIGSHSHELPFGNKITFVQRLLKLPDNKEAYKWIAKKFNIPFEKQNNKQEKRVIGQPKALSEVAEQRIIEREMERNAPSTGYPELDKLIGGLIPGHLITLTADTNVGKTAFAANITERLRQQGKRTVYFALEPEASLLDYLASVRLHKQYADVKDEDLRFDDGLIKFYGKEQIQKIEDLVIAMRQMENRYDLAVIDHLGFFVTDAKNWIVEQAQTLKKLAGLTKELKMTILIIAHLRKPERSKSGKEWTPTHDDISGSAAFKQDSQDVLIITRPVVNFETYEPGMVGKLFVSKAKKGRTGAVSLAFADKSALIMTTNEVMGMDYTVNGHVRPEYQKPLRIESSVVIDADSIQEDADIIPLESPATSEFIKKKDTNQKIIAKPLNETIPSPLVFFGKQAITKLRKMNILGIRDTSCPKAFKTKSVLDHLDIRDEYGKWHRVPKKDVKCESTIFYTLKESDEILCLICNSIKDASAVSVWYQTTPCQNRDKTLTLAEDAYWNNKKNNTEMVRSNGQRPILN